MVPRKDTRPLWPLLARCPRLLLEAGAVRTPVELPPACLLVVERGKAVLLGRACVGRRIVVAVAVPGDLLAGPRGQQQLVAVQDLILRVLTVTQLRTLLQQPPLAEVLLAALLRALRDREESLSQFANVAHAERLRGKLLQLARCHGKPVDGGVQVELPLTQALLAQMVGSARETVSVAVRALEQEGFLVREGATYTLLLDVRNA